MCAFSKSLKSTAKLATISGVKPSQTKKRSGKTVDIVITPALGEVIERARAIKKKYKIHGKPLITLHIFPTKKGTPYSQSGLFSMWDRARDRIGIDKDSPPEERIQFKDLRTMGLRMQQNRAKK